ncbi:CaiB/BaiF CoA transferase family protein [Sporomusa acidovorans]|uniref:Acetyl-CoA:oxalate CoA-transferase n=1 Tax=Sporomusa acidovorans (strain ATCC 49682 / DSM 3132 / Mol) TaxID=1123286 RepID=A0ABZ3IZZ3_SPOA4|nr:CoA transferase [Sporomusa acidovorans]OZC14120.1 formyl-coenzyme A transferase [Sporomusa acidovorans DSM 3132]SDE68911.1 CoA:oxalate CoA-transferase [Sporomusa acidovorans]
MKALEEVRVLDLSRVLAGPYCTMMLADFGADIIKIEPPGVGDDSRAFGPFVGNESAYFMSLNRNKRSIILNFKRQADCDLFKELVKQADVVVENYRPGTMEKFGLGYEVLKEINPGLIYAACSGFGHTGPYRDKPAYDIIVQAMGGIMSITGPENGEPTRVGASVGDVIAGMFTAYGVMTALFYRQRTGQGQKVDVGMLDCQLAILENAIARYVTSGNVPGPLGNRHPSITPFASYTAKDGYIIVGAGNDRLWEKLCNILERPDLIKDPRFDTNLHRTNNAVELGAILNGIFTAKPIGEWIAILEKAGLPCAPINTIDKVVSDPHVAAREMIVEVEHPVAGKLKMPGVPVKMSQTPGGVNRPAPLLGQHTGEILQEMLGWDQNKVNEYLQDKD